MRFLLRFNLGLILHVLVVAVMACAGSSLANAGEALFGPEFNFTNQTLIQAGIKKGPTFIALPESLKAQEDFAALVAKKCAECKISPTTDKLGYTSYVVKHPDGWAFYISIDPWVVEVQVDPMTEKQIAKAAPEMQRLIFDSAHDIQLESQDQAGHIHIGVASGFAGNPLLFRNFIVDWIAHSRMAYTLFGANSMNAPTVDMLGSGSVDSLAYIIKLFDESLIWKRKGDHFKARTWVESRLRDLRAQFYGRPLEDSFVATPSGLEMTDLSAAILDYVYFKTVAKVAPPEKYQNLNLTRMRKSLKDQTVELRSVHEMASANEYLSWARLLQGRINHLESQTKPIPFVGVKVVNPRDAIDDFHEYTLRSGMDWTEASHLMKRSYRMMVPSARAQTCSALFFSAAAAF